AARSWRERTSTRVRLSRHFMHCSRRLDASSPASAERMAHTMMDISFLERLGGYARGNDYAGIGVARGPSYHSL
ncbi:jg2586, partial [Pararge aegeria aegeria]